MLNHSIVQLLINSSNPLVDQDLLDKSNSECDHCQAELRDQTLDMALDQTNKQTWCFGDHAYNIPTYNSVTYL